MSYCLTVYCGCVLYVACHPATGVAHTRIIQSRGPNCRVRRHEVGLRLYLWEILPNAEHHPTRMWMDERGRPDRVR